MKTVLITGGSRGIGAQLVRTFRENGWQVAFTYQKSREQAEALALETEALAFPCDAANEEETRAMAKEVLSRFHHMDALHLFIHSSVERNLDCFQLEVLMNRVAINI